MVSVGGAGERTSAGGAPRPRPRRRALAGVLVATGASLLVAAPAQAGSLLTVSVSPNIARPDQPVTLHGRSGPSTDGFTTHSAVVYVMRPGEPCPAALPDRDDPAVIGRFSGWTFGEQEHQPRSVRVLINRPSAVGTARICTFVSPTTVGGNGDPVPGPRTSVRVAANPRAWASVVGVTSPSVRVRGGRTTARVTCSSSHHEPCLGSLRLRHGGRTIASGRFDVRPGAQRNVSLRLTRAGTQASRRASTVRVTAELRPARGIVLRRPLLLTR